MSDTRDTILRLAGRGEGQSESGRFVPLAAPGDWLDAAGALHHGPHHQAPPCRHFPKCGGCQLQHVDDTAYADWMVARISGALAAQDVTVPPIRPPHLSPPLSRRRAALKAQRLGGNIVLGFNEPRSARIVDLRQCEVLHPGLFALVAPLRRLLGTLLGRRGVAGITLCWCDQGADVLIAGVEPEGLAAHEALSDFAAGHRLTRLAIDRGEGPETLWEPEPVTITLGTVAVPLPHGAFLQATADGEAQLVAAVREAVGDAASVTDLFAGLGTFALALAGQRQVTAVEAARDAILSLRAGANRASLIVTTDHRDLYRRPLIPAELSQYAAVVLDPPRAGAEEQVKHLAASPVPRIAYVSCNPVSFARDARILAAGGYRIDWVQPVGQFRWSTHMELAASLSR